MESNIDVSLLRGEEEGVLQTRQPLGLEAEPRNRGLPITGSQIPGPYQTKQNKQKNIDRLAQAWGLFLGAPASSAGAPLIL